MLAAVFAVFTFCYVTRTFYDIFVTPTTEFGNIFSGICLPLLWDFTPISMMFIYHFQNLIKEKASKKPVSGKYEDTESQQLSVSTGNRFL